MDPEYKDLSVTKQCELLDISRTAYYYSPDATCNDQNFSDLQLILDVLRKIPFYGYRKISRQLLPKHPHLTRKRVRRIMRRFGLRAIYAKKNLSKRGVIAAHVTNMHLDLAPVVHRLAREMGWHSREIHAKGNSEDALQDSQWILIAEDESIFQLPNLDVARVPDQRRVDSAPLWTDQYHDLFSVLKL